MSAIQVIKLNEHGKPVLRYDGVVIARDTTYVCVRAVFQLDKAEIGMATLSRGDIFYEWFYTNRWYNVFRIHAGSDNTLKGWYCNITRPAVITANTVQAEDLALDVFIMPDGKIFMLDEDEFNELDLTTHERTQAEQAVNIIRGLVRERAVPFDPNTPPPK